MHIRKKETIFHWLFKGFCNIFHTATLVLRCNTRQQPRRVLATTGVGSIISVRCAFTLDLAPMLPRVNVLTLLLTSVGINAQSSGWCTQAMQCPWQIDDPFGTDSWAVATVGGVEYT